LLQSERNATLLIDVLRSLVAEHRSSWHDFRGHSPITSSSDRSRQHMTIEKAMQLIKGRFSHRLSHELGLQS